MFNRSKTENEIPILWQLTAVKSIYKGGVKEKIQENQIGMFLVNIISKISDESVLKIQNENKNENISQIEITGRKQRSAVDNLIILNWVQNQNKNKNRTYLIFQDAQKVFW